MKDGADSSLETAELAVERSRERLFATLAEIQHRLDPRVIAAEAVDGVVDRAVNMFDTTRASVRNRPLTSVGALLAFLAPIGLRWWLARAKKDSDET